MLADRLGYSKLGNPATIEYHVLETSKKVDWQFENLVLEAPVKPSTDSCLRDYSLSKFPARATVPPCCKTQ